MKKPSWDEAPPWATYLACRPQGDWQWFDAKPEPVEPSGDPQAVSYGGWMPTGEKAWIHEPSSRPNPDWLDTLEARPYRIDAHGNEDLNLFQKLVCTEHDLTATRNQRDTAWNELRQIRKIIGADPEESTLDEVEKLVYQYMKMKNDMRVLSSNATVVAQEITTSLDWLLRSSGSHGGKK